MYVLYVHVCVCGVRMCPHIHVRCDQAATGSVMLKPQLAQLHTRVTSCTSLPPKSFSTHQYPQNSVHAHLRPNVTGLNLSVFLHPHPFKSMDAVLPVNMPRNDSLAVSEAVKYRNGAWHMRSCFLNALPCTMTVCLKVVTQLLPHTICSYLSPGGRNGQSVAL